MARVFEDDRLRGRRAAAVAADVATTRRCCATAPTGPTRASGWRSPTLGEALARHRVQGLRGRARRPAAWSAALNAGAREVPRSELDGLTEVVKRYGAGGLVLGVRAGRRRVALADREVPHRRADRARSTRARRGRRATCCCSSPTSRSGRRDGARRAAARARRAASGSIPEGRHDVLWVVDFPMFECNEDEQRWDALHHPFTAPTGDLRRPGRAALARLRPRARRRRDRRRLDPYQPPRGPAAGLRARSGIAEEEARGALRLPARRAALRRAAARRASRSASTASCAILAGRDSIRDVIAFPKTASGADPLTGAPAPVDARQLAELGVQGHGAAARLSGSVTPSAGRPAKAGAARCCRQRERNVPDLPAHPDPPRLRGGLHGRLDAVPAAEGRRRRARRGDAGHRRDPPVEAGGDTGRRAWRGKAVEKANEATAAQDAPRRGSSPAAPTRPPRTPRTTDAAAVAQPADAAQPPIRRHARQADEGRRRRPAGARARRSHALERPQGRRAPLLARRRRPTTSAVRKALARHRPAPTASVVAHAAHIKRIAALPADHRAAPTSSTSPDDRASSTATGKVEDASSATSTGTTIDQAVGATRCAQRSAAGRHDLDSARGRRALRGASRSYPRGRGHVPAGAFAGAAGGAACGDLVRIDLAVDGDRVADAGFEASGCGAAIAAGSRGGRAASTARRCSTRRASARARSPPSSAGCARQAATPPSWPPTRCTARSARGRRAPSARARAPTPGAHARRDERRRRLRRRRAARARATGARRSRSRSSCGATPENDAERSCCSAHAVAARALGRAPAWACRTSRSTCATSSAPASSSRWLADHAAGPDAEPVRALQRPRAPRRDARLRRPARRRATSPPATTRASATTGCCARPPTPPRTRPTCSPRSRPRRSRGCASRSAS